MSPSATYTATIVMAGISIAVSFIIIMMKVVAIKTATNRGA